jgi:hypothetical protein
MEKETRVEQGLTNKRKGNEYTKKDYRKRVFLLQVM